MPNLDIANQWRTYAKTDYNVAVHDTTLKPVPIEIICYHCQQAGEKALKAILAYHDVEIPRIHDLYRLLNLCVTLEPQLPNFSVQTKRLSDFSTITRYPSNMELEEVDMNTALNDAQQILEAVFALW